MTLNPIPPDHLISKAEVYPEPGVIALAAAPTL